jgi:hypothetical protein
MAVVGGFMGAVKGGEVGALGGIVLTRSSSAPQSSSHSAVIEPVLELVPNEKVPGDPEKPVDLLAYAPQVRSPTIQEKSEALAALPPTALMAEARPADALPSVGASWRYAYAMQGIGSTNYNFEVRVASVEGGIVRESINIPSFPEQLVAVSADSLNFRSLQLPQSQTLVELAPYLHSILAKKEPRSWSALVGYPAGNDTLAAWVLAVRESSQEYVTVGAGTFSATMIEVSGRRMISGNTPYHLNYESGRFRFRAWYAPQVQRYVKLQHETWSLVGAPFGEQLVELTRYNAN